MLIPIIIPMPKPPLTAPHFGPRNRRTLAFYFSYIQRNRFTWDRQTYRWYLAKLKYYRLK